MAIQPISSPIRINETSAPAANLQAALLALGFSINVEEVKRKTAGAETLKAVRDFQSKNSIQFNDSLLVDDVTASALNTLLKEKGLFDEAPTYQVSGKVLNALGEGLGRKIVMAYDVDLRGAKIYKTVKTLEEIRANAGLQLLGNAVTQSDGGYTISFNVEQFNTAELGLADVVVYAVQENKITGRSSLSTNADYKEGISLQNRDVVMGVSAERGMGEFTKLLQQVTAFLRISDVPMSDLFNSPDQLAFLAVEIQQDPDKLQLLVKAAQLAQSLSNNPESHQLLYGLGREKITLSFSSIALTPEEELLNAWQLAITQNIIDPIDDRAVRAFLAVLHSTASMQMLTAPQTEAAASLVKTLNFTTTDINVQSSFLNASRSFTGTTQEFWNNYLPSLPEFSGQPQLIKSLQLTNQLVALTDNHIPLVGTLQSERKIQSPADLLSFTDNDWKEVLKKSGIPDGINGDTNEEKFSNYKNQLQTVLNAAYPTQKIAVMVKGDQLKFDDPVIKKGLTSFFSAAKDFDIKTSRVIDFETQLSDAGGQNKQLVKESLAQIQRLYAVSPAPDTLAQLMDAGFHSANQIANIPQQAFLDMHSTILGGPDIAFAVHQRASFQTLRMEKLVAGINEATHAANPQILVSASSTAQIKSIIQSKVPNWTSLFGSPDICECAQCRSVYSAAAYLVDILQFLGKLTPNFVNKKPLEILLQRRPDIAFLPLTCENTNTLVPYIDLVNEIMEYYVAHGSLDDQSAYDTGDSTADELRANPQHTLKDAYNQLKDAVYPFSLPYNQPLDVERIYYNQMRTTRAEVMTVLQRDFSDITNRSIHAELLMLSQEEYIVLTGMDFAGNNATTNTRDYYGDYADDNDFLSKIYKIPEFLRSTGLSYTDTVNLLQTRFINPGQTILDYIEELFASDTLSPSVIYQKLKNIAAGADTSADADIMAVLNTKNITPADFTHWVQTNFPIFQHIITSFQLSSDCDLGSTQLRTLQSIYENQPGSGISITDIFPKIHRFIRARNKLKWDMFDLDTMIEALGEEDITDTLIDKLAIVNSITALVNIPLNKLATIWGDIQITGKNSLYKKLFLNRTIQNIDAAFLPDQWGIYLSDDTALLKDHQPAIQAAFRVSGEDLNMILTDTGLPPDTSLLNIENLSIIYRFIVFSKALGISISNVITIKQLFQLDPFSTFDTVQNIFTNIHPTATLAFVKLVTNIQSSGFKISTLNYIIGDITDPQYKMDMPEATAQNTMMAIRKGFFSIDNDHPDSDLQNNIAEDLLGSKMQLIYQPDTVNVLISVLNGTAVFSTTTDKNLPVTIPFPQSSYINYITGSGRFQCTGVLSDTDKTLLNNLPGVTPAFQTGVQDLYLQPEQFIKDNFTPVFNININEAIANLLNHPVQVQHMTEQDKLNWFYKNFLPYLKNQLRRNIVVQTIATVTELDEPTTQVLLQSQADILVQTVSQTGLTAVYYIDETFTTAGLNRTDRQVDFSWDINSPDPVIPADNFSVRWEGYVNPPGSGDYTLIVQVADADDGFMLFADDQLLLEKNPGDPLLSWENLISLTMNRAYKLTLEYVEQSGLSGIQLYWKTATTPKQVIDTVHLYPAKVYADLLESLKKFQKAAIVINGFKLKAGELGHFIQFSANFSSIDFGNISKDHWQRIFDYTILRKSVPVSSVGFIELFQLANRNNPAPGLDEVLVKIGFVTGWNPATISWLVKNHFNLLVTDFKNEIASLTLLKAIKLIQKTGVAADALATWSAPETDFNVLYDQSQDIKKAVKAKFEDNEWLSVAKKLSDKLRENQKLALIDYLLVQPELIQWGVADADSLYEYFLIDVQMCACMDTSRIVQATAAVQLFVTRCLLNLESKRDANGNENGVAPDQVDKTSSTRWEWMQYYRVWEANRKVFLYPENWLDPEYRDDKSPFFKDLESELLQNDITRDSVDDAFYNYLNKLDEISHLDICGMYQQNDDHGKMLTLHVFGRTNGRPHICYYRTCNKYWHWSPWEKVPVDIKGVDAGANSDSNTQAASGVHLTPVIWKDRLFIFWPEFLKKQEDNTSANSSTFQATSNKSVSSLKKTNYWEISLASSEYKNGKWTPKKISKEFFRPGAQYEWSDWGTYLSLGFVTYESDLKNYSLLPVIDDQNKLTISLIYKRRKNHGRFMLSDIHNPVQIGYTLDPSFFDGLINGKDSPGSPDFSPLNSGTELNPHYASFFMQLQKNNKLILKGNTYLKAVTDHRIIYSPQLWHFERSLNYPFFYMDDYRSYFVRTLSISYLRHTVSVLREPQLSKYIVAEAAQYAEVQSRIPQPPIDPVITRMSREATGFSTQSSRVESAALQTGLPNYAAMTKTNNTSAASFAGIKNNYLEARSPYIFDKGLAFYTNYHPYSQKFIQALNTRNIDGLMECDTVMYDRKGNLFDPDDKGSLFEKTYLPNHTKGFVKIPADLTKYTYYKENVAFDEFAPYGLYNWELFYHAPLYIATRLSKNGKYQEAMKWFHYIFDPTTSEKATDPNFPEGRYWKVLPFKTTQIQSLLDYFESLQPGTDDPHISEWKDNPFKPFLVARGRPIAFMKNVVMKYIDNLVAWGDDLFRTDTRENINTATQLYIIAAHILGPTPPSVPARGKIKAETYHSLRPKLDAFSNAIVDLENLFPYSSEIPLTDNPFPGSMLGVGSTLYFCIPNNGRLLQYWDTVADRLFKIRHCMNIEGVERSLALFAPPIDPGLLVRAIASGLSIGSILADLNSPAPLYRFGYLVQKATEFCAEVKALGSALLAAIEKKENEELARLRAGHETILLNMITGIKERQILESKSNRQNLEKSRETIVKKIQYHLDYLGVTGFSIPAGPAALPGDINQDYALPDTLITDLSVDVDLSLSDSEVTGVKIIAKEKEQLSKGQDALDSQLDAIQSEILSGFLALIPEFNTHATPLGVGMAIAFGGKALSWMASADAKMKGGESASASFSASKAATMAAFIRRDQESTQQANQALRELAQLDKQLLAADIRIQITEKELQNHRQQISHSQEIEDYLQNQLQGHTKFTTQEFYLWMKEQLFFVYKQSYQMAFDMARRAEKAYQFESGDSKTNFIQYGYFDSTYQGLTAGEQLHFAIKQLEKSFIEQNKREFELTKHISLAMTRPDLLLQLKQNGSCEWAWQEELFDLDYPGHYFRRIKSVNISIPCVVGPYTTINATLRLLSNSIRINTSNGDNGYEHNNDSGILTDDDRFTETKTPFVAIATSSAQNDSGVFELNFRDDRYLPFEGAGVISKWKLELNGKYLQEDDTVIDISQFDFRSISDIIIHVHYTSREDAGQFRQRALTHLQDYFANSLENTQSPLLRLFSAKHDLPTEWYHFLHPANNEEDQSFALDLNNTRFPFFVQKKGIKITMVELVAESALATINGIQLISPETATDTINLVTGGKFGNLRHGSKDYSGSEQNPGPWIIKNPVANARITDNDLSNLAIIVHYETS